jgi:hypothetical protein
MRGTVVKVVRSILDVNDPWRAFDEQKTHDSQFMPNQLMKDIMGARMVGFFLATWGVPEGEYDPRWIFHRRLKTWYHW